MAAYSSKAPTEFAEGARSACIYAPVLGCVGTALVAIGGSVGSSFPVVLGVIAYLGAVGVGLTGMSSMISAGRDLLARNHEASELAIRHYRSAASATRTGATDAPNASPPSPVAADHTRSEPTEVQDLDLRHHPSGDPASFVALLKSLSILDATRDVQRLYGNSVCASFVNRKCVENDVAGVNLVETDIPAKF